MTTVIRQVATSSIVLFVESIVRLGLVAAVSFWVASSLGPAQFGILNFASAIAAILFSIASLGLETPVILRLTKKEGNEGLIEALIVIRVLSGFLLFFVGTGIAFMLKGNEPNSVLVSAIVLSSLFLNSFYIVDTWFKAKTQPIYAATARLSITLIAVGAKVICLLYGLGLVALAWTVAFEGLLTSIAFTVAYLHKNKSYLAWNWPQKKLLIQNLLREGWPYLLTTASMVAYMKIDVILLGYLSNNREAGVYSLAQKITEVMYVVPTVLIESLYPTLTRRHFQNRGDNAYSGQMLFDIATSSSIVTIVVSIVVVPPLIDVLFGRNYSDSTDLFLILSWSCLAVAMNSARYCWLATLGLQRYAPVVTFIGLVLNVGINIWLIPRFGALGAAIATLVSYCASSYLSSFLFPPMKEIALMQTRALWPWNRIFKEARQVISRMRA
jgi:polysaccharide transporter, PST family